MLARFFADIVRKMRSVALVFGGLLACACGNDRAPFIDVSRTHPGTSGSKGMSVEPDVTTGGVTNEGSGGVGASTGEGSGDPDPSDLGEGIFTGSAYLGGRIGDSWGIVSVADLDHYVVGFAGHLGDDIGQRRERLPFSSYSFLEHALLYTPDRDAPLPTFGVRRFEVDGYGAKSDDAPPLVEAPADNDEVLDTPACPAGTTNMVADIVVASRQGRFIYRCPTVGWFEGANEVQTTLGPRVYALSGDLVLFARTDKALVVGHVGTDEAHELGLSDDLTVVVGEQDGGFWLAQQPDTDISKPYQLYSVGADGVPAAVGLMPTPRTDLWSSKGLDRQGRLYLLWTSDAPAFPHDLFRLTAGAKEAEQLLGYQFSAVTPTQLLIP